MNCATFDIEASSLNANFGIVYCCCIKPLNGPIKVFRGDKLIKDWAKKRSSDKELVAAIIDELREYDILIAHNGMRYDIPFINSRAIKYNIKPLPVATKIIDPVLIARKKLKLSYNSLENIIEHFGLKNLKTSVNGDLWIQCIADGNVKAMDEIVSHCKADVELLEQVYNRIRLLVESINNRGSN